MAKLWGHTKSGNVQKVLWSLDELGVSFERIDAGGPFGRVKDPDYLALNPNGLVPTLEDDGAVLWESHAIVRYLFAKYGGAPAFPSGLADRARADAWTDWAGNAFWPHVRALLLQLVRTPADQRNQEAIAAGKQGAEAALRILDAHLAKRRYVVGEEFTYGDVSLGVAAHRLFGLPFERAAFPAAEAWYGRLRERAPFRKWVAGV